MITLGINAAFHDCAAALMRDGALIAAAEEERFSHVKHGKRPVPFTVWQLPFHAIDYCLREAGVHLRDVDRFAYSLDPGLLAASQPRRPVLARGGAQPAPAPALPQTIELPLEPSRAHQGDGSPWDALQLAYVVNAPRQLASGAPHHLQARLGGVPVAHILARWQFVEHHLCHEASAFLAAPFDDCAVLTLDGRGERATTSAGRFRDGSYRRLRQVDYPHSLGLIYEDVTRHLGFLHSSDEYKVMALACFGQPRHADLLREHVKVDGRGGYTVRPLPLAERCGPPRTRGGPLTQDHYDLACSLQLVLEEAVLELTRWLHRETGARHLAMAGGVALNCVMNARLRDEGPFEQIWVQPAAGDAGTALGAALWADWQHRDGRSDHPRWHMRHAYWGPAFGDDEIERFLKWSRLRYRRLTDLPEEVAAILAEDRVIGWFQHRMEFGPRALGARSILASPISPDMQQRLNEIKDREDFRPVAPVVPEDRADAWFARRGAAAAQPLAGALPSPFMLFIFDVRPEVADRIPAVRHSDGTARIQTVRREDHPQYYDLLCAFERRTGVPVLVNTSFNTRGVQTICTPRDAVESFWTSPLDALVIGSFLLEKPG